MLQGWGGPRLLDSYEAERRPIQTRVIAAAVANNRVLATDLLTDGVDAEGPAGERARDTANQAIQASKRAEFHALSLVLDLAYAGSPVIVAESPGRVLSDDDEPVREARPGARLPHAWIADGRSIYDDLGDGMTLLALTGAPRPDVDAFARAAAARGMPLRVLRHPDDTLRSRYQTATVLVRPDQHVAWCGDALPDDAGQLINYVRGAGPSETRTE